jgi:hypothetical protein
MERQMHEDFRFILSMIVFFVFLSVTTGILFHFGDKKKIPFVIVFPLIIGAFLLSAWIAEVFNRGLEK